ncbi:MULTISPECIES: hypothetical protein [Cyanophyceae]|uniref:hypothetical protein n=1 Tax=Cyanophyceae TaxID=3028117 RepID=UPI0016897952|nr:hypothetical protein [Trichocoleus sp. FACHB-40]MBD2005710.1 hypothetical protein [Trichocoleus sp. FACHB-40]
MKQVNSCADVGIIRTPGYFTFPSLQITGRELLRRERSLINKKPAFAGFVCLDAIKNIAVLKCDRAD